MSKEDFTEEDYNWIPKDILSDEEFAEANRIYKESKAYPQVVKYINSKHPDLGLKCSKFYFELYIENK